MTQPQLLPGRPPVLAVLTALLGLGGAGVWAVMAVLYVADGALGADQGAGVLWFAVLAVLAGVQAGGAVRLLRRRGWLLLALGSVPGVLPLLVLAVLWTEYRQELTGPDVLAALPVLPVVLLLLPHVRRWAARRPAGSRAEHQAVPTSGA